MTWLKTQLDQGIVGTGRRNALVSLVLAAGVFLASLIYDYLNHGPNVLFLKTPLDDLFPVIPVFVIPYDSLKPFIYVTLVLLMLFRTRLYHSAALSLIAAFLVSYIFYFFLQTVVVRPLLPEQDLFTQMVRDVYASDNPFNDFPSLHTSLSTILAVHWWRADRRIGWVVAVWVTLIVLSTLFVKQHYLPDVVAGLILAFAVARYSLERVAGQKKTLPVVQPEGSV